MVNRSFSLYEIESFVKEAGAERISEDAVRDLEREIEKLADVVAKKAMKYAEHAGRKRLIRSSDIMLTKKLEDMRDYRIPKTLSKRPIITNTASNATRQ
jgi:histone H3/H4